jgi:hypothetical protein
MGFVCLLRFEICLWLRVHARVCGVRMFVFCVCVCVLASVRMCVVVVHSVVFGYVCVSWLHSVVRVACDGTADGKAATDAAPASILTPRWSVTATTTTQHSVPPPPRKRTTHNRPTTATPPTTPARTTRHQPPY